MTERQVRILLSGGIGAGKSAVGELLRARGALVIDADHVGHGVLEPGGEAYEQVVQAWPEVVVDGIVDRKRLADIVFDDPAELERLEAFTHGAIRRSITATIEASCALMVVVEVPLLSDFMGNGWIRVVVDAEDLERKRRLLGRGMDAEDVARRMAAQPGRAEWITAAHVTIDNSGSVEQLEGRVAALWALLQGMAEDETLDPV